MFFSGQVRRSVTAVSEKRRVVHVCARRVSFVMDRRAIGVYETTTSVGKPYETMCVGWPFRFIVGVRRPGWGGKGGFEK